MKTKSKSKIKFMATGWKADGTYGSQAFTKVSDLRAFVMAQSTRGPHVNMYDQGAAGQDSVRF